LDRHFVLEFLHQRFYEVFVPILFEVAVGGVKATGPLFFVKEDLVGLVEKVGREEHNTDELEDLGHDSRH
jgi:hypothetical protein